MLELGNRENLGLRCGSPTAQPQANHPTSLVLQTLDNYVSESFRGPHVLMTVQCMCMGNVSEMPSNLQCTVTLMVALLVPSSLESKFIFKFLKKVEKEK